MKKSLTVRIDTIVLDSLKGIAEGENKSLARIVEQAAQRFIQTYDKEIPIKEPTKKKNVRQPIVRQSKDVRQTDTQIVLHKEPEQTDTKPIQPIKNQPLRSYIPKPNPNKARWDKLKDM